MKTHTDIDVVRSWSFEKQMGWVYALNIMYGKDQEMLGDMSNKVKSAGDLKPAAPPMKRSGSLQTTGKRFIKQNDGTLKTEVL